MPSARSDVERWTVCTVPLQTDKEPPMELVPNDGSRGFPETLQAVVTQSLLDYYAGIEATDPNRARDGKRIEIDNVRRHNEAVHDFIRSNVGATNSLRRVERRTLSMFAAFETWCGDEEAGSGYGAEHITHPTYNALVNVLNLDCGRLDCGVLSEWLEQQCKRVGMDSDTGVVS